MAAKQIIHFRFGTQPGPSHFADRCCFNPVRPFRPEIRIESPHPRSSAYFRSSPSPNPGDRPMKMRIFRQLVEVNPWADRLLNALKRLEAAPFLHQDLVQHALSGVEIARVYANRERFNNFQAIVENAVKRAYRFQRRLDEQLKDQAIFISKSEQRRTRKGLLRRPVVFPDWDLPEEDRLANPTSAKRKIGRDDRRRTHSSSPSHERVRRASGNKRGFRL
jgi:hypothetical protein